MHPRSPAAALLAFAALLPLPAGAVPPPLVVNSKADAPDANPGDGICATAQATCTLRAAIMEANHSPGITVQVPASTIPYTLTIAPSGNPGTESDGDLDITGSMSIVGGGAEATIVDGGALDGLFDIDLTTGEEVTISGLTVRNGLPPSHAGGGIFARGGAVTVSKCRITGNTTTGAGDGGGIATTSHFRLVDSTVDTNLARGDGGGVAAYNGANLAVVNSTIVQNKARLNGGGLQCGGSPAVNCELWSATVTHNRADDDDNGTGTGGGVAVIAGGVLTATNSILAGNTDTQVVSMIVTRFDNECIGTLSSGGHNVLKTVDAGRCTVVGPYTAADPLLGTFGYRGGPVPTHPLLAGSPAIDGGVPTGCEDELGGGLLDDERGANHVGSACDIGAYEYAANGDANGDEIRNVSDVFWLINYLFAGGQPPQSLSDVNGDFTVDVADVFYLINFLFAAGPAPL
jgi:CSLREA domain-containing protein